MGFSLDKYIREKNQGKGQERPAEGVGPYKAEQDREISGRSGGFSLDAYMAEKAGAKKNSGPVSFQESIRPAEAVRSVRTSTSGPMRTSAHTQPPEMDEKEALRWESRYRTQLAKGVTPERLAEKGLNFFQWTDYQNQAAGTSPRPTLATDMVRDQDQEDLIGDWDEIVKGLNGSYKILTARKAGLEKLDQAYQESQAPMWAHAYNQALAEYRQEAEKYDRYLRSYRAYTAPEAFQGRIDDWEAQLPELEEQEKAAKKALGTERSILSGAMRYGTVEQRAQAQARADAAEKAYQDIAEQNKTLQEKIAQEKFNKEYVAYEALRQNPDFEGGSVYKTTANGLTPVFDRTEGVLVETGFDDIRYDAINGKDTARSMIGDAGFVPYEDITPDQVKLFNYIYATKGPKEAYNYMDLIAKKQFTAMDAAGMGFMKGSGVAYPSIALSATVGNVLAKLTGNEDMAVSTDDLYQSFMGDAQQAAEQHRTAGAVGSVAGTMTLMYGAGKAAGAVAEKAVPAISGLIRGMGGKTATSAVAAVTEGAAIPAVSPVVSGAAVDMVKSALTFAATDAVQNAGDLATGGMSAGSFARSAAGSAAGGAVGTLVAGKVTMLLANHFVDKQIQSVANLWVQNTLSSFSGAVANTGIRYVIAEDKPTTDQLAVQLASAFAFSLISGGISALQTSKEYKEYFESEAGRIAQAYKNIWDRALGDGKSEEGIQQLLKETQELRGSLRSAYLPGQQKLIEQLDGALGVVENGLRGLIGGVPPVGAGGSAPAGGTASPMAPPVHPVQTGGTQAPPSPVSVPGAPEAAPKVGELPGPSIPELAWKQLDMLKRNKDSFGPSGQKALTAFWEQSGVSVDEGAGRFGTGPYEGQDQQTQKTASVGEAVKVDTSRFDSGVLLNLNKAREYFVSYVRAHFPTAVVNVETGKEIGISRTGIDKFLSGRIAYEKYASGFHIPELIETAHKVAEAPNSHLEQAESIPTYEYYDSPLEIEGKDYMAHIRVRNTRMGDRYYGHTISEVEDIKIEPSARASVSESPTVQSVHAIDDSISDTILPQGEKDVKGEYAQESGKYDPEATGKLLDMLKRNKDSFGPSGQKALTAFWEQSGVSVDEGAGRFGTGPYEGESQGRPAGGVGPYEGQDQRTQKTASVGKAVKADTSLFDRGILQNFNAARKKLIEFARGNFPAMVVNAETGRSIGISRTGLDKFLSGNIPYEKYASGFHIPELIERAHKVNEAANYHLETAESIPTFEYFNSPIEIDGKMCNAHIRVKNTLVGDKYYGHTISEVEDIKIEYPTRTSASAQPTVQPENTGYSISDTILPRGGKDVKGEYAQESGKYDPEVTWKQLDMLKRNKDSFGPSGQKALTAFWEQGGDPAKYFGGFAAYYDAGVAGIPQEKVNSMYAGSLTEAQKYAAYVSGQNDAAAEVAGRKSRADFASVAGKDSGLVYDEYVRENMDVRDFQRLNQALKRLETRAYFVDKVGDGMANGAIAPGDSDILLSKEMTGREIRVKVAGHELGHRIRDLAPEAYQGVQTAMVDALGEEELSIRTETMFLAYQANGLERTSVEILEEVTNDYIGELTQGGAALDAFLEANKAPEKRSVLEWLRDAIRWLIRKLTGKQTKEEARQLAKTEQRLKEALEAAQAQAKKLAQRSGGEKTAARSDGGMRYAINKQFNRDVQEWYEEGMPSGERFILGSTGSVLQGLGAIESDIYMNGDKISTILEDHPEMSIGEIERIPELLEYPALVLKSKGTDKNGDNSRLVIFGSVKAQDGRPIMCVLDLRPTEDGFLLDDMQKVNSAYTKDSNPKEFISSSEVLYANKNRAIRALRSAGFTDPVSLTLTRSGSIGSITYRGKKVNISGMAFSDVVRYGDDIRFSLKSGDGLREKETAARSDGGMRYSIKKEDIEAVQAIGRKSVNEFTSGEIKATEPFARKYWQEMGEKSPFFRAWFGDWRVNDQTPVGVVTLHTGQEYTPGRAVNEDTGMVMSWGDRFQRETIVHDKGKRVPSDAVASIGEIVKNAVLLDTVASQLSSKSKMPGTAFMHSFYAIVDDGSGPSLYKLFAEEALNSKGEVFTRAYELKYMEKVTAGQSGVHSQTGGLTTPKAITFDFSVADLFRLVKEKDPAFSPKEVSRVVDDEGKPLVVYHGTDADFNTFRSKGGTYWFSLNEDYAEAMAVERGGDRVVKAYLNLRNPYRATLGPGQFMDPGFEAPIIQKAKAEGHDGAIITLNENDPLTAETFYMVFAPEQIKSAADNIGAFDKKNPDIRYSLKGEEELLKETRKLVKQARAEGWSDARLRRARLEAVERVYQGLIGEYGAIPAGETPAREIQTPRRTSDTGKVSQTVRTILEAGATPEDAIPTIQAMTAKGEYSYSEYSDKAAIQDAEGYVERKGWAAALTEWDREVSAGTVSKRNTAVGWALYNTAANSGDVKTALHVLDRMIRHQRSAAQAVQATRILKKLSPETQLYQVQRSVADLQKEIDQRYGEGKERTLTIDETLAERFLEAEDQEGRDRALADIYRDIGRQMPSRFRDKWNAWRYLSMLGNPRTHVRNIVGNAGFAPVVAVKDLTAAGIEAMVARVSGNALSRTKSAVTGFTARDRALLAAAWGDYANVREQAMGEGKYSDFSAANKYVEEGRRIFKTKPLEALRKANGTALDAEDAWFSRPHYAYAMAQYCKANRISPEQISAGGKGLQKARAYAVLEAQKATYRDANALSQTISGLGRNAARSNNRAGRALNLALEGILPFRKTPANILARGLEYSPAGLIKGVKEALLDVKSGKKTGAEAIDSISAGLTGTGLLVLGMFLAAQGLVRGHGGDDEKEREFEELMGRQAYSLEVDGTSVTLDWLAPECLPFFVGVNLWEQTRGQEEEANLTAMLSAAGTVTEPLLEMSCLQSLNDVFDAVGYAKNDGLSGLPSAMASGATSYLTQVLPTLAGQAERTGEGLRMTTYTETNAFLTPDMQYTIGKASARIPGWDYRQIPYIDAWGRVEKTGGAAERGVNNFLNPAFTSRIETSGMEKELLRVYKATGESGVLPKRAAKYFTVDGERKDLTAEEYVEYATRKGQNSYELLTELVKSAEYQRMDDGQKAAAIENAYKLANQRAKEAVGGYTVESWIAKAAEAERRYGIPAETYIMLKTEAAGVQSLKDGNGDTIPNSKGLLLMQMVYETQGLSEAQRKAMFDYLGVGKSVRHYNKAAVKEALERMEKKGR